MITLDRMIQAVGCGLILLFLWVPTVDAGSKKGIVIKIATLAPEGSAWTKTLSDLNTELKEKTNNGVRLKIYPGGVLGDERDMIRKMYVGQIHGAVLTSGGLSTIFGEMDAFQIPFLFKSYDEVDYVLEKMDAFFKAGFEKKGYILPAWSEGGFVRILSTLPMSSLEDLRKAKVWTWAEAPMAKAIFDEAGISAIPLSLPDVLVGLQTGLVDVVYAPPSGAISLQWFTKTKYMTDVPLMYLIGALVIKKNQFKKLPKDYQQVLWELCPTYMDRLKLVIREENQEAIRVMTKHGLKLIQPSADQIKEFKEVSRKAMQHDIGDSFSETVKNEMMNHLVTYRASKN